MKPSLIFCCLFSALTFMQPTACAENNTTDITCLSAEHFNFARDAVNKAYDAHTSNIILNAFFSIIPLAPATLGIHLACHEQFNPVYITLIITVFNFIFNPLVANEIREGAGPSLRNIEHDLSTIHSYLSAPNNLLIPQAENAVFKCINKTEKSTLIEKINEYQNGVHTAINNNINTALYGSICMLVAFMAYAVIFGKDAASSVAPEDAIAQPDQIRAINKLSVFLASNFAAGTIAFIIELLDMIGNKQKAESVLNHIDSDFTSRNMTAEV